MTAKIQLRGNCQCCGALQAQTRGSIAKHGYTVEDGWFKGVCQGNRYPSMQVERKVTDSIVAEVRADVAALLIKLSMVKDGTLLPETAECGRKLEGNKWVDDIVPYADAEVWYQKEAVRSMIFRLESRIRAGNNFADQMENIANRVHGTPLVEVVKPVAAPMILRGEVREDANGTIKTALMQDGARVYFTYKNSAGKEFKTWIGSRVWRQYKLVEKVVV